MSAQKRPAPRTLLILGPGRSGIALGLALRRARPDLRLTYVGRHPDPPDHPIFRSGQALYERQLRRPQDGEPVVFAVPDDRIISLAEELAQLGPAPEDGIALHLSGALSAHALAPLAAVGYATGTLHPLQAIADPDRAAPRLSRSWFAVSGAAAAEDLARALVSTLGARTLDIPEGERALYHAAAVLVSNSLPALLATGARLLVQAGAPPEAASRAMVPLVTSALDNVLAAGPSRALTGPVARGDVQTVRDNIRALPDDARELYVVLARSILSLAADRLGPERSTAMEAVLKAADDIQPIAAISENRREEP